MACVCMWHVCMCMCGVCVCVGDVCLVSCLGLHEKVLPNSMNNLLSSSYSTSQQAHIPPLIFCIIFPTHR